MVLKAPHQTRVRPLTEPYEMHRERQRRQQKDLKVYLRMGPTRYTASVLMPLTNEPHPLGGFHNRLNERKYYKKVKISGTYVMPMCPFCDVKEKLCTCLEGL